MRIIDTSPLFDTWIPLIMLLYDCLVLVLLPQDSDGLAHLVHFLLFFFLYLSLVHLNHEPLQLLDRAHILDMLEVQFLNLELSR